MCVIGVIDVIVSHYFYLCFYSMPHYELVKGGVAGCLVERIEGVSWSLVGGMVNTRRGQESHAIILS